MSLPTQDRLAIIMAESLIDPEKSQRLCAMMECTTPGECLKEWRKLVCTPGSTIYNLITHFSLILEQELLFTGAPNV